MIDYACIHALRLVGVIFAVVGVIALFVPHVLFDPIGVSVTTASGLAEIRAAYGSFFLCSAGLFWMGSMRAELRRTSLTWACMVLTGFVVGRLISLAIDGMPNGVAMASMGAEIIGAIVAGVLLHFRK